MTFQVFMYCSAPPEEAARQERQVLILFLRRCAVITEFARDFLTKTEVKLVVPGEEEELPASVANDEGAQVEVKNGANTVTVGEKYEVRSVSAELLLFLP